MIGRVLNMQAYQKNGDTIVETDEFSLKIASDRTIYVKNYDDSSYQSLDVKIRKGMSTDSKIMFLENMTRKLQEKRRGSMIDEQGKDH